MLDEESSPRIDFKDTAIKAFARYGIVLDPRQVEGERERPDSLLGLTRFSANLDSQKTASGNESLIRVTFVGLQDDFSLEAYRDILNKYGIGAGITCMANIDKGEVKNYKIYFALQNAKYTMTIELSPDGEVLQVDRTFPGDDEDQANISLINKFPPFPVLLQRFTTTPLDPNNPASLFSPLGDLSNELAAKLALPVSS